MVRVFYAVKYRDHIMDFIIKVHYVKDGFAL